MLQGRGHGFNPWLGSWDPTCLRITDLVPQWKIPHDSTKILWATTEPAAMWLNKRLGIMTCVHLNHITLLAKTEINVLPVDTHLSTSGQAVSGERVNGLGNFWLQCRNHTWTPPPLNLRLVSLKWSKNFQLLSISGAHVRNLPTRPSSVTVVSPTPKIRAVLSYSPWLIFPRFSN